jgi:hypothetical protein
LCFPETAGPWLAHAGVVKFSRIGVVTGPVGIGVGAFLILFVFSRITSAKWRVGLVLFVISLDVGVIIYAPIWAAGNNQGYTSDEETYIEGKGYYDEKADETHTKMPQSEWNVLVVAAIKAQCPVEGMTKEEVDRAIGKPVASIPTAAAPSCFGAAEQKTNSSKGETWLYEPIRMCRKYEGENCVKYEAKETPTFYFSPNGHLTRLQLMGRELKINCSGSFASQYPFWTE